MNQKGTGLLLQQVLCSRDSVGFAFVKLLYSPGFPLLSVRACVACTRAAEEKASLCQLMEGMVHVTEQQDIPARAEG